MSFLQENMNSIVCGDCLEVMKKLPDKCIDLVLTDPPYFDGPQKHNFFGSYKSRLGIERNKYVECSSWDVPDSRWYDEILRVSKHQIIFGINYFEFSNRVVGRLIWDKNNRFSSFSKAEIASCSKINSVQMYRYTWNGFIQGKIGDIRIREKRIHPTQKPVPLMEEILRDFSKQEDLVLDCFSGSGTTAVACCNLNRRFICIEKDPVYWAASVKRLEDQRKQLTLF